MILIQDKYRKATMNYDTATIEIARLELALEDKARLIRELESIQKNMISEIHWHGPGLENIKAAAHTAIENTMQESQTLKAKCSELERRLVLVKVDTRAYRETEVQCVTNLIQLVGRGFLNHREA
jgi:hypothetical protein